MPNHEAAALDTEYCPALPMDRYDEDGMHFAALEHLTADPNLNAPEGLEEWCDRLERDRAESDAYEQDRASGVLDWINDPLLEVPGYDAARMMEEEEHEELCWYCGEGHE